jgi:hypothetical protein
VSVGTVPVSVYESKTSTADFKARMAGNRNVTPEMQKNFEEGMKSMFENIHPKHKTASTRRKRN